MESNASSVALFRAGEVLLIERAFEPLKGLWTLPGGRREAGESSEATAIREIAEEVGIHVRALRPVLIMPVAARFYLEVFATRDFDGEIVASDEIAAWRWLEPGLIGELPTTPGLADVLDRAMAILG
jgi:8-oxo-dGTP pyrophosphatase MutT (NUDIX family)